jgi:hypothetical protein
VASAFEFEITLGGQGAIFHLSGKARDDRRQIFGPWEVEVRKGSAYIAVRSATSNIQQSLDEVIEGAYDVAQDLLDIVAVEDRDILVVIEPYDNVVWRTGPHGLKLQSTSSIVFGRLTTATLKVIDTAGNVRPEPPYIPPQYYYAFRYFRFSQAAQNVFDGYRNMFLAFESLLDYVDQKQPGDGETEWLERALITAQSRGLDLSVFTKHGSQNPVDDFLSAHYSAIRCAAFHSKSSTGDMLLPGRFADESKVLQQLLAVQELVEALLRSKFSTRLASSGSTYFGFKKSISELAPIAVLFISVADCPTIEQVIADEKDLPEGIGSPVTFVGARGTAPDEWLLVSEMKPMDLSFSRIRSLWLVANPNDHLFLRLTADKMNCTLMPTDLDVSDVSKLVLRVRCVLRNLQGPKLKFSH